MAISSKKRRVILKRCMNAVLLPFLMIATVFSQKPAATIPEFKFFNPDKTAFTNKDLNDSKLLFFIFFDTGCDHCKLAMQKMNQHYSVFKNVSVYLITMDNEQNIKIFLSSYAQNLLNTKNTTILLDLKNEFIDKFTPRKYPSLFLYSPQKKLMLYEDDEEKMDEFFKLINSYHK